MMILNQRVGVKHRTACPKCRRNGRDTKGDNLIVYNNEGAHCFSCGYHEQAPSTISNLKDKILPIKGEKVSISLPDDVTEMLPFDALQWMMKYGLTGEEIKKHNVLWSPRLRFLIFPFYDNNKQLLFWIARNFDDTGAKYKTVGPKDEYINILYQSDNPKKVSKEIVVCEDMLSAIKISKHTDVMPMLGATLGFRQVTHLARYYHRLIIWGDRDKQIENCTWRSKFSQYFREGAGMILSSKDPKEYSHAHIEKFLDQQKGGSL